MSITVQCEELNRTITELNLSLLASVGDLKQQIEKQLGFNFKTHRICVVSNSEENSDNTKLSTMGNISQTEMDSSRTWGV